MEDEANRKVLPRKWPTIDMVKIAFAVEKRVGGRTVLLTKVASNDPGHLVESVEIRDNYGYRSGHDGLVYKKAISMCFLPLQPRRQTQGEHLTESSSARSAHMQGELGEDAQRRPT